MGKTERSDDSMMAGETEEKLITAQSSTRLLKRKLSEMVRRVRDSIQFVITEIIGRRKNCRNRQSRYVVVPGGIYRKMWETQAGLYNGSSKMESLL